MSKNDLTLEELHVAWVALVYYGRQENISKERKRAALDLLNKINAIELDMIADDIAKLEDTKQFGE